MTGPPIARVATALGLICAVTAAGTGLAQGPAKAADQEAGQCFYARDVNGFQAANDRTVYIRVGVNDIYRLDLMYDCTGLTFRQSIGINSVPSGDSLVCSAIQADVVYQENGIPERCPVTGLHKLSADEITALPKRDRP